MSTVIEKKAKNRIDRLGFESINSLADALRIDRPLVEAQAERCKTGYPYESWTERKKSGGSRLIEHPYRELKYVQVCSNRLLQRLRLPPVYHGCIPRTSIKTNAISHCHQSWFLGIDLADYFLSIRPEKVYTSLRDWGAAPDVARLLTTLTTINHHVPQGAPTSPIIAALAMSRLIKRLQEMVQGFRARLTVFGDNIAISSSRDLRRYKNTISRIVKSEGFRLRNEKTIIASPSEDKILPGLVIRKGSIQIAEDDLNSLRSRIGQCVSWGSDGLANYVCRRYFYRLQGYVNHYMWLDPASVREIATKFGEIKWPVEYRRDECMTMECHCS